MTPTRTGFAAGVLGVLLAAVLALPAAAAAVPAAPGPAGVGAATDDGADAAEPAPTPTLPLTVQIVGVTPRVLGPGEDLRVRVEVTNAGTLTVTTPRLFVHLDRTPFISRSSLDRWRNAGIDGTVGSTVLEQDLTAPLAPGQTATVMLTVPASAVRLPTRLSSWGARGLAVQVVDAADPARARLGLARTFALWFPEQEVTATRLSVVAPITGVGVDPHSDAWVDGLEELTRPGGRLGDLLAATGDHAEVTWVVDPWFADAAAQAGPLTQSWVQGLLARTTDREVYLLPYLDPDLAAIAHTGASELLSTAVDRAESVAGSTDLPDGALVSLAWPADDLPDLPTAALTTGALVVGPGELPSPGVLTYTPTGRTTVTAGGDDVTVLVPDERLSAAFRTGSVGPLDAEPVQVTPATAAQDLLAELAVITRERPNDGRHMLVTVPRDWAPEVAVTTAQLDALEAAPWVRLEPVSALVGAADPGIDRGTLPERTVSGTEVDTATLGTVRDAVERRRLLAGITADPAALLGDLELEQLAPTSVAWRDDPVGRSRSVAESHAVTETLGAAVSVEPAGDVTLVSTSGRLPVEVTNTLDQDATVSVALRPADGRLVADEAVPVVVPAGGGMVVQIPVHAIQSGDVVVTVELRTADGMVLDDSTRFTVGVRAEWEGIGTAVAATLLALGLVASLIRTIRRGRSARRAAPQVTSGPDALSPEEGAGHDAEAAERAEPAEPAAPAEPAERAEPAAHDARHNTGPDTGPDRGHEEVRAP
jgi:hypothetical protein